MKVTYTSEQKRVAIQTYRRVKSYAKTIQILGYPSYHVLIDWVKGVSHGRPNKVGHVSPHHYSWQTKRQAVDMMLAGVEKDDIATQLSIHCSQQIYKWVRIWRTQGDRGLMSKSEKGETARRPTKKQLLASLPEDRDELKELAVNLMVQKAILEKELELLKADRATPRKNCR